MKVLIFADSHGYNMAMAFAVDREEPDAVIHLGDHAEDAREIERVFPAMPICRVRGNNDFDPDVPLNAVVTPGGVRICNPGSISLPRGGPASYARLTIENGQAELLELVDEDGSLLRKEKLLGK